MAVAVYVRVSTEEQRERQSIMTQSEFAERYCQLHSLATYRIYSDDGVSGTVPLDQRPEGSQILAEARLSRFDQLLIYKLDRLGRETRLILNAVAELEKLGVRVRSMTEEFDTGTATGRLMLTMLSGFASHEREVIRERSLAGTNRVAEAGAWLGGIVPYGYRKVGEKAAARLVVSDEPIAGMEMTEADVIRMIYRMAAVEKQSCMKISAHLNRLGVPCAYARDGRTVLRGKRKQRTSGLWRPGRVRNLIISTTYMGQHQYGKRSPNKARKLVTRPVPAIVPEATWKKAQNTLQANFLFGMRSARNQYLLRGLIKCGLCGRTYIGVAANRPNGKREFYYRCNGAHSPSVYGTNDRCSSKAVRGDHLEMQVWSDVETFLRKPESVLEKLHARLRADTAGTEQAAKQISRLQGLIEQKAEERSRVVGLFRRGRLSEQELDAQLDEIAKEERALDAQIAELRGKLAGGDSIGSTISSAQALLAELGKRLDEPVSWEQKRRLIEVLVAGVRVDTVEECSVKQSKITVTYRFNQPDHPMRLVLPQSYSAGKVIRIPTRPQTIGDHMRRRRLDLKMLQREVAEQVGVNVTTVRNWESGGREPELRFMPAVIEFLGYNPLPAAITWGERLVRQRRSLGLSQEEAAREIGIDRGTLARWERGEREPERESGAAFKALWRWLGRVDLQNPGVSGDDPMYAETVPAARWKSR